LTYRFEEKAKAYAEALRAAGLEPVFLTPDALPTTQGFDGLLLSGGTDLDPALYGQTPYPETEQPDRDRDAMEISLLRAALSRDLPVLAICRGMQLFNIAHGGSLHQHLASADRHRVRDNLDAHGIAVQDGSQLARIVGSGEYTVNSRHHQGVDRVGSGLNVSAYSDDGVIEGLERADRKFTVAVQWHPEDRIHADPKDLELFRALARAIGR